MLSNAKKEDKVLYYSLTFFIIGNNILAIETVSALNLFFNTFALFSILIIIVIRINHLNLLSWSNLLMLLFFAYLSYVSHLHGNRGLGMVIPSMFITLNLLYSRSIPNNASLSFSVLANVFFFFYVISLIQILVLPEIMPRTSMGKAYLIAYNYNQMGGTMIPGLLAATCATFYDRKYRYRFFMMLLTSLFTVAYVGSLTSSIGILLILLYYLFANNSKFISRIFFSTTIFLILFIFLDFVLQSLSIFSTDFIYNFFEKVGKDPTFTGRTYLWTNTLLNISFHPITGYGTYDADWATMYLRGPSPHNTVLNIILQGGLILLLYVIFVIISLVKNVKKTKTKEGKMLLYILLCYLLMMQFEVYNYFVISLSLLIVYMFSQFIIFERGK